MKSLSLLALSLALSLTGCSEPIAVGEPCPTPDGGMVVAAPMHVQVCSAEVTQTFDSHTDVFTVATVLAVDASASTFVPTIEVLGCTYHTQAVPVAGQLPADGEPFLAATWALDPSDPDCQAMNGDFRPSDVERPEKSSITTITNFHDQKMGGFYTIDADVSCSPTTVLGL